MCLSPSRCVPVSVRVLHSVEWCKPCTFILSYITSPLCFSDFETGSHSGVSCPLSAPPVHPPSSASMWWADCPSLSVFCDFVFWMCGLFPNSLGNCKVYLLDLSGHLRSYSSPVSYESEVNGLKENKFWLIGAITMRSSKASHICGGDHEWLASDLDKLNQLSYTCPWKLASFKHYTRHVIWLCGIELLQRIRWNL